MESLIFSERLSALQVTGYSAAVHDRFASGFPTAPTPNSEPSFVGAGLDLSGVAWSSRTHAAGSYKAFALLSPIHFLTAQHYEYSNNNDATSGLRIRGRDQMVHQLDGVEEISNLGNGLRLTNYGNENYDLAIGQLTAPITLPNNFLRPAVLDLHSRSSDPTLSAYKSLEVLFYGRSSLSTGSPRIATVTPDTVAAVTGDPKQVFLRTTRDSVQLEPGDSGAPALHQWNNPDGSDEPVVLGVNSAIDTVNGYNFVSMLATPAAMTAANAAMTPDGYALRVVGTPSHTWVGSSSMDISRDSAWGLGGNANSTGATDDKFVLFDAATASARTVNVNASHNLRGLYFKSTGAVSDSFSFSGTSTLTIGRGGITNYDSDAQTFAAPLLLSSPQFWDAGPGGLLLTTLDLGQHLLEIRSSGLSSISSTVSGSGGLALESGRLRLSGACSYTGDTWVHDGTLEVAGTGSIASSASVRLSPSSVLSGSGSVSVIRDSGLVSPGAGAAILTASANDPSQGLDFAFEFSTTNPVFSNATASGNDVLRLRGMTPFATALNSSNTISLYLNVGELADGQQFHGGFFTDNDGDFFDSIKGADIKIYTADPDGSVVHEGQTYSLYSGNLFFSLSTVAQTADFPGETVNGRIAMLEVIAGQTYQEWSESTFPAETPESDRLLTADPNNDGVVNLLAYAFKLDPMNTSLGKLPTATVVEGGEGRELLYRFRRNVFATDLKYEVLVSTTLLPDSWTATWVAPTVVDPDPDGDGLAELVEVRVPIAELESKKFAKLKVTLQ